MRMQRGQEAQGKELRPEELIIAKPSHLSRKEPRRTRT
jgi:hypothetical protein